MLHKTIRSLNNVWHYENIFTLKKKQKKKNNKDE